MIGYTIEPGLYFKNFGIRSEVDFYINAKNQLIITSELQTKLKMIN